MKFKFFAFIIGLFINIILIFTIIFVAFNEISKFSNSSIFIGIGIFLFLFLFAIEWLVIIPLFKHFFKRTS